MLGYFSVSKSTHRGYRMDFLHFWFWSSVWNLLPVSMSATVFEASAESKRGKRAVCFTQLHVIAAVCDRFSGFYFILYYFTRLWADNLPAGMVKQDQQAKLENERSLHEVTSCNQPPPPLKERKKWRNTHTHINWNSWTHRTLSRVKLSCYCVQVHLNEITKKTPTKHHLHFRAAVLSSLCLFFVSFIRFLGP